MFQTSKIFINQLYMLFMFIKIFMFFIQFVFAYFLIISNFISNFIEIIIKNLKYDDEFIIEILNITINTNDTKNVMNDLIFSCWFYWICETFYT